MKFIAGVVCAAALSVAPGPGVRAEELSVTQWGNSLYGAPFAVALEDGHFNAAGIKVTGIIGSGGGGTSVRNTLAAATPYGDVALPAALAAVRQGLDIVIINTGTRTVAESSVVTMPGSPLTGPKDLAGRKVAITNPKSSSEITLLLMLESAGLTPDQVERVAAGGYTQSLTMLEQKAVDAAVLIEPLSLTRKDNYKTIARAKELLPAMTTSVGITTRAFAEKHPEKLRAIIAGRREAVKAIYADPEAAAAKVARQYEMNPDLAREAMLNMIEPRMWSEGEFNREELDRTARGLILVGEISDMPDWDKILDTSFLPPDLRDGS